MKLSQTRAHRAGWRGTALGCSRLSPNRLSENRPIINRRDKKRERQLYRVRRVQGRGPPKAGLGAKQRWIGGAGDLGICTVGGSGNSICGIGYCGRAGGAVVIRIWGVGSCPGLRGCLVFAGGSGWTVVIFCCRFVPDCDCA